MKAAALITMILALTFNIYGESLWGGSSSESFFTGSNKRYQVGDIVTVLVNESNTATNRAQSNTQKSNQVEISAGNWTGLPLPDLGGQVENSSGYTGQGTTTRSGSLQAKITAQVMDILPNGNLVLQGERKIQVNEETEILQISGIARPRDVSTGNTIESQYLADAQITYTGRGEVHNAEGPGAIARFFNWIF